MALLPQFQLQYSLPARYWSASLGEETVQNGSHMNETVWATAVEALDIITKYMIRCHYVSTWCFHSSEWMHGLPKWQIPHSYLRKCTWHNLYKWRYCKFCYDTDSWLKGTHQCKWPSLENCGLSYRSSSLICVILLNRSRVCRILFILECATMEIGCLTLVSSWYWTNTAKIQASNISSWKISRIWY